MKAILKLVSVPIVAMGRIEGGKKFRLRASLNEIVDYWVDAGTITRCLAIFYQV